MNRIHSPLPLIGFAVMLTMIGMAALAMHVQPAGADASYPLVNVIGFAALGALALAFTLADDNDVRDRAAFSRACDGSAETRAAIRAHRQWLARSARAAAPAASAACTMALEVSCKTR